MKHITYKTTFLWLLALAINAPSFANNALCLGIKKSELGKIIGQNNDLPALLMSLKILTDYNKMHDEKAPIYNLCTFESSRYKIFCQYNKGMLRIDMPQISGQPKPGSKAEQMVKNGILQQNKSNGEVDLSKEFIATMNNKFGVLPEEEVDAATLKATQKEIAGCHVAGMWWSLKQEPQHKLLRSPLFIAKDNYIIDGHHRWAAINALEYGALTPKPIKMRVIRINTDVDTLLKETLKFTDEYGIEPQSA